MCVILVDRRSLIEFKKGLINLLRKTVLFLSLLLIITGTCFASRQVLTDGELSAEIILPDYWTMKKYDNKELNIWDVSDRNNKYVFSLIFDARDESHTFGKNRSMSNLNLAEKTHFKDSRLRIFEIYDEIIDSAWVENEEQTFLAITTRGRDGSATKEHDFYVYFMENSIAYILQFHISKRSNFNSEEAIIEFSKVMENAVESFKII